MGEALGRRLLELFRGPSQVHNQPGLPVATHEASARKGVYLPKFVVASKKGAYLELTYPSLVGVGLVGNHPAGECR